MKREGRKKRKGRRELFFKGEDSFLGQQALEENLSGKRTEETKRAIATKAVPVCTSLLLEF